MIKTRVVPISHLLAFCLLTAITASAQTPVLGGASAEIRAAVQAALPPEGLVIFQQDQEVYLDLTVEKGAYVGRKYTVERVGAELRHPVTGESLGNARTRVGEVQVTWLQDGFVKAKILEGAGENGIRVKDVVRPSEPPVVARLGIRHDDGSLSKLTEAIDGELATALAGLKGATNRTGPALALAAEAAGTVTSVAPEADIAVAGRVVGDAVEVHVVAARNGRNIRTFRLTVPEALRALGAEKVRATPSAAVGGSFEQIGYREGGEMQKVLDFIPSDMTTGDVDGDGTDELIFAEEKSLRIMKLKMDGSLEEVAKVSIGWTAQVMHIFAGDIDKNGRAEIFVVEKPGNYVRSAAYRFENGRLNRFFRLNDSFLRVIRTAEGDQLFGQRYGSSRPFERGVMRYVPDGNGYKPVGAGLPGAVTVYDFVHLGQTGFTASIDYENRIRLYNTAGEMAWTSSDNYGGSDIRIESADKRNTVEERSGLVTYDLDGDNVVELIAVQNLLEGGIGQGYIRVANIQQYRSGRLVALALENGSLVERWKTKTFNGIIKGFTIARPLSRGSEAVFFTLERVSFREKRATLRVVPLN